MASERVHVLFVVTNYPPHHGGVQVHVQALAREIVALGASATVVCLGRNPGRRDEDGVRVVTLQRHLGFAEVLALPGPREWRRRMPDLAREATHISTHTRFFPMSWLGLRAGRRAGRPVVHTEHGAGFVRTGAPVVDLLARLVDLTMGRAVLRGATRVLAVSDAVADFVRHLAGRESVVVGNGVH
ncbi:MAG TPA: glycosyltransferase, partial [Candidatus Lustribacter sp.]|nr:glycosyltransferase [Candidatus Lustribacter sp.]